MSKTIDALLADLKVKFKTERIPYRVFRDPGLWTLHNYIHEKNCTRCGRQFWALGHFTSIIYCSTRCQQDDRNERRREQRAQERAAHKRERGKCVVCGMTLVDQVRGTRRYCSDAHRQQAYRSAKRKRAER
jgi:hypothetical protein